MKWKNRLIEAGVLIIVFIIAVLGFSYYTNKGNDNMTADMGAATYPQVSFSYQGYALNMLSGYAKAMDIPAMRDTITPVTNQRLEINVQAYGNKISSASYTIYTLDGEEKLKEEKVKNPGENITADLSDEGLMDEERVLEISLYTEDKTIYFYTRIVNASDASVMECLDYIRNFHESALGKVEGAGVGAAIEPSEEGDNTSFLHVTIHSDYDHVSWGSLEPEVEKGERWNIKEINSNSISVQLEYRVRCKGEENETDVYAVKEFFRVRHIADAQKTYLLNYDRTMEQIFDATKQVLNEKGVLLGIAPKNISYMVNDDGSVVSFVVANELWNYNKDTDEVSQVFSFADAENSDVRNLVTKHEIKLLEMDETGNTIFAVCGYMNRGSHEGEVGIAVYYYDMEKNSVEEKVFISSDKSYENVINEMSRLVYYSASRNMLYIMVEGTLYEFDVEMEENTALVEALNEDQYVVSEDGHLVAYQENGDLNTATKVVVKNLESGKERTAECESDECIRPLGFVKNDFVYGVAKTADTGKTVSGEITVPMYKVEIQNSKSEIVKTYQADGTYVLDAYLKDNMVTLNRAVKDGNTYTSTSQDYITNNTEKEKSNIYLESYATDLKETQVRLTFEDGISDKEPKVLRPKQIVMEDPVVVEFEDVTHADKYYVYGYGQLQACCEKAGEAIRLADSYSGVVVDATQNYIWERGNRDLQYTITDKDDVIQRIADRLKQKEAPVDIMKSLNDDRYLDLTGCATEELLYIINQGSPVIGMLNAENSVILIGYTDAVVIYVDPETGERSSVTYEEMDQMTQGSGNTYIG